jgi:flagellar basal body rod protein FlgG
MSFVVNPWNFIRSMKSVDDWSNVLNANIAGTTRAGFKQSDLMFGGGKVSYTMRPYFNPRAGIQIGEQALQVDHTFVNFGGGSLTASDSVTHLAINGMGFFRVAPAPGGNPANDIRYTRDGEFRVQVGTNRLINNDGLYVLDTAGNAVVVNPGTEKADILANVSLATFGDEQGLAYDPMRGSTYFMRTNSSGTETVTLSAAAVGIGTILTNTLEASNVNLANQLAMLNTSEKFFEALTKQLTVYLDNIDQGLRLFR